MSHLEFDITVGPSFWKKDHVVLKSLSELRRLCHLFNIPLLHMSNAQHYIVNIPSGNDHTYDVYFANMSGMYYTYTERHEAIEGVSS